MEQKPFLIIGNGIAGATAAELLRSEDSAAAITVIANDPFPVYYRPALKDYLGGKLREEKLWVRPTSFYDDHQIRFHTDTVIEILPREHTVQLYSGQKIPYIRLLLAYGARASSLHCPGEHLTGVATLRTVADYQKVLAHLEQVKRVVIVGSGTLALESIETLRHRGFEVTHLLRRRSLWSEVLDPTASDLVLQQEQRDGVDIRMEQEIAEITGKNGCVNGVITTTGAHIACEMVLLGIGIEPLLDLARSAGIACDRGIKVDGAMRTNVEDIYAAGDLIETTDQLTGKTRVIGQWYPAIQQARAAAYSMLDVLDTQTVFQFGNFYNASMLYGLEFASVGLTNMPRNGKGYQEIQAEPKPRHYQKVLLKDGVPTGMIALGDRRHVITFKRAVDHRVDLSPVATRLFAPDFDLRQWLNAQGVPPAILGAVRVGATAVQRAAYAGTKQRSGVLPSEALTEGMLIQVDLPPGVSTAPEIYLSQINVTTIGRQDGMSLAINHSSISRRHAEISYANGRYVLRDLGSKNGTVVNSQKLEPGSIYLLNSEDTIRFGQISFVFKLRQTDLSSSFLMHRPKTPSSAAIAPEPPVEKQPAQFVATSTKSNRVNICNACSAVNSPLAQFCTNCGSPL
jgi:NADPH-dependent 2,4-dienoyl-CoA reductase/sulfur reductase-like enzyme/pSer/pThr/pTyr-binding forkhead associated (FHA) protein/ribosomal protein L40E